MILYVDSENKIRAVDETSDPTLTPIEIADEDNPFLGHSNAYICCYKVTASKVPIYPEPNPEEEGEPEPIGYKTVITMMTPYIDSRSLDAVDLMGRQMEEITPYTLTKTAYYGDTEITFYDVPDGNMSVYVKDSEGNYPNYTVNKVGSEVTVNFEAVTNDTEITLSIL